MKQKSYSKHRNYSHKTIAIESLVKILINIVLSIAAYVALLKLIPNYFAQKARLKEIHVEVQATEARLSYLNETFQINFDPSNTYRLMERQSPKIDPKKITIFWLDGEN